MQTIGKTRKNACLLNSNILLNVADWMKSAKKPLDKQLIYRGAASRQSCEIVFLFNILLNVADWIKSAKKPLERQP